MGKICRHKNWKPVDIGCYKECVDCGVWLGERSDPHDYTKQYYHKNNTIVDDIPQRQWYWSIYKTLWDELGIDFVNEVQKVLEFGCGIGLLLWTIHRKYGIKCIGVESSYWAYNWQREVYGFTDDYFISSNADIELQTDGYLYNCGEREDEKRKYDFIYSNHVLEHLQDPMAVLEQCYRLLTLNGHLFITVPDREHQKSLHVHRWTFDPHVLQTWFAQAGFYDIKTMKTKPHNPPPVEGEYPGHYLHISGRKV